MNPHSVPDGLETEVAIIGAGASGVYAAYRLTADPTVKKGHLDGSQVQVFEMSDRIGGRLWSVTLPGMAIPAELGGMRYMTQQMIATTLIEVTFKSELKSVPFPMGTSDSLDIYLRKQRLKQDAWIKAQHAGTKLVTNYILNGIDVGYDPDQLFNKIIYETLVADPWFSGEKKYMDKVGPKGPYGHFFKLTAEDWDDIKPRLVYNFPGPYNGRKVNDIGFWNLIKDRVSQEGYEFLADSGGYYSNTINWNAAEAFPYMVGDFSDGGTEYKTIAQGYDRILLSLAGAYAKQPGARIWMESRLVGFTLSTRKGFKYALRFANGPGKTEATVYANRIVLAMPRKSLELLDPPSLALMAGSDANFSSDRVQSVIMEPSLKILMAFDTPWWHGLGMLSGHSITDLPMRQCYYFGTDPNDSHSLLLGSYNDMDTVSFWEPLIADPVKYEARPTKLVHKEKLVALDQLPKASAVMVAECVNQLQELHGAQVTVPTPNAALFWDWRVDPYGGGYHAWKAGVTVAKVMKSMRKPNPAEAIHVCGEAYSDQQGWIEGAFCVTERMLQEHLGLVWPDWLDTDYYLGW